jgi:hypothetical protein
MVWAYSPEGTKAVFTPRIAALPKAAEGALSIALLDNRKANAGILLKGLGDGLEERLGASIEHYSKPNASVAADPELLDQIATHASFAVAASSD